MSKSDQSSTNATPSQSRPVNTPTGSTCSMDMSWFKKADLDALSPIIKDCGKRLPPVNWRGCETKLRSWRHLSMEQQEEEWQRWNALSSTVRKKKTNILERIQSGHSADVLDTRPNQLSLFVDAEVQTNETFLHASMKDAPDEVVVHQLTKKRKIEESKSSGHDSRSHRNHSYEPKWDHDDNTMPAATVPIVASPIRTVPSKPNIAAHAPHVSHAPHAPPPMPPGHIYVAAPSYMVPPHDHELRASPIHPHGESYYRAPPPVPMAPPQPGPNPAHHLPHTHLSIAVPTHHLVPPHFALPQQPPRPPLPIPEGYEEWQRHQ